MGSEIAVPPVWSNEDLLRELAENEKEKKPTVIPPGSTIIDCNLNGTVYDHSIDFSRVTFKGPTHLDNVSFRGGVFLVGAVFLDTADFSTSRFVHFADFANTAFHDTVSFFRITVDPREPHIPNTHNPGEANFSYSRFFQDANFERAKFSGPAYFHRASFFRHADFTEVHFEDEAIFQGWQNDVTVPKSLVPEGCQPYLHQLGLVRHSAYNGDHYLNFDLRLGSEEELRHALSAPGTIRQPVPDPATARRAWSDLIHRLRPVSPKAALPFASPRPLKSPAYSPKGNSTDNTLSPLDPVDVEKIVQLYKERRETPLFSRTCETSFRNMVALENVKFSSCDLHLCRFEGASVDKLRFFYVTWRKCRAAFGISNRNAVRDEEPDYEKLSFQDETGMLRPGGAVGTPVVTPRSPEAYHSLRNLYRGLRRHAEEEGELEQAQDFYFGELEMVYRSRPRLWRWTSWEFFYRFSSGYGKQDKLAATWLLLMVFLIFPFLYGLTEAHLTHNKQDWNTVLVSAEAHSLQASTLLATKGRDLGPTGDLINGIERLLVPLQAGLLILAIRYNFQRRGGT